MLLQHVCVTPYNQVLNSPFDTCQFSIAGAQNDTEREFVLKASNPGDAPLLLMHSATLPHPSLADLLTPSVSRA